jgi:hypothetical protein
MSIEEISKTALLKAVNHSNKKLVYLEDIELQKKLNKIVQEFTDYRWAIDFYFWSDEPFHTILTCSKREVSEIILTDTKIIIDPHKPVDEKIELFLYEVFSKIIEHDKASAKILKESAKNLGMVKLYAN